MVRDSGKGRRRPAAETSEGPLVVEGGWILRAVAVVVTAALVCGYLTFCGLFYQGQWQIVLHPVRTEARPALPGGGRYDVVRFGPGATGVPQRVGWWLPTEGDGAYRQVTILYLPSGDGSLASQTESLALLHRTGATVFAFDWRAYGASAMLRRPSEASMREDAEAAWQYLVETRGVPAGEVIPYGRDLGATVALWLAGVHRETSAVVLDSPRFDVTAAVAQDPRVRLLPVGILFKDRFELQPMLRESKVPKLLVVHDAEDTRRALEAGDPKLTVTLPRNDWQALERSLLRFLGQYAPAPAMGTTTTEGRER